MAEQNEQNPADETPRDQTDSPLETQQGEA